jgi:hypothetical protein
MFVPIFWETFIDAVEVKAPEFMTKFLNGKLASV